MKKQLLFPLIGFIMVACSGDKENESKNEKKSFCDCIELSIDNAMQAKEAPEGCDWIKNLSFEEKEKKINTNCPDLMGYLKMYEDLPGNVENTDKEKEAKKESKTSGGDICECLINAQSEEEALACDETKSLEELTQIVQECYEVMED